MYEFKSSKLIQQNSSFQDNINEIVKKIKIKQQIIYELIQYIQNIYINREQIEKLLFIHDEISKHQFLLNKLQTKFNQVLQYQQTNIIQKLNTKNNQIVSENQKILLKRVAARILQIFQTYNQKVQKFQLFDKEISMNYKIHKNKCIKYVNIIDKNESNYSHLIDTLKLFFQYSNNKFKVQTKKLRKIIQLIENGQIYEIQNIFNSQQFKNKELQQLDTKFAKVMHSQSNLNSFNSSIQKPYESLSLKNFAKQKQKIKQRLKIMRNQSKQKQIIHKNRKKFATKYYKLYHTAMQINKAHFIQDLIETNKKTYSDKVLAVIIQRNKQNKQFISSFTQLCSQKKYDGYESSLLTNKSDQEIKLKSSQTLNVKSPTKNQKKPQILKIQMQQDQNLKQVLSDQINQQKSFRITSSKRNVNHFSNSNINLLAIKACSQSFNFVKLNMNNNLAATNINNQRSKFPGLQNRLFSMEDKRKSLSKITNKQSYLNLNDKSRKDQLIKNIDQNQKLNQFKSQNKYSSSQTISALQKKMHSSKLVLEKKNISQSSLSRKLNKFCQIISSKQLVT